MATTQGQDVVLCQLCTNPVEHHCNLCRVNLCSLCTLKHLADKTNRHEIVEFINRKEGPVLPECAIHKKNRCELYCKDCLKATCVLCVSTEHKKHDLTDIQQIIENSMHRMTIDLAELENVIVPKFKNLLADVPIAVLDKVLTDIQDQEDEICKIARDVGSQMRDKIKTCKQKNEDIKFLAERMAIDLNETISTLKNNLISFDFANMMSYESKNENCKDALKNTDMLCPFFLRRPIEQKQVMSMFGEIFFLKKILETPVVLNTIQSPYGNNNGSNLCNVLCEGKEKLWTCGDNGTIFGIDRSGLLLKTFKPRAIVRALAVDLKQDLMFIVGRDDTDTQVYKIECGKVLTLLNLLSWLPRGLCYTPKNELLVSMRSTNKKRSRVLRYSGITVTQIIENDSQGRPLFSVGNYRSMLHLTENGNGDICVADCARGAVVVVDGSGDFRFKYNGNPTTHMNSSQFKPFSIVNNINFQLLITDSSNDTIHIIDWDGNFIRYIEYPCAGGITIDTDHNLVIGDSKTGLIRTIKYLE